MKITDLIIDPKSLGEKLWLVEVTPAYEYRNNQRTENVTGYRYAVAMPDKGWKRSTCASTANSLWKRRTVMRRCVSPALKCSSIGATDSHKSGQRQRALPL